MARPHNSITAAIPSAMLETPTGPRFHSTPSRPNRDQPSNGPTRQDRRRGQGQGQGRRHQVPDTTPVNTQQTEDESLPLHSSDAESEEDNASLVDSSQFFPEDAKALVGLRDISSLATWTLSSAKPGCALAQLRHPSTSQFWQSDGPQPHSLTLHFFKLVCIVKIRVYLDFKLDESYTPTKMRFLAGMSEGGLVEFANWEVQDNIDPETGEMSSNVEKIRGWIDVSLNSLGGCDTTQYEAEEQRKAAAFERRRQQRASGDADDIASESDDDDYMEDEETGGNVLRAMILQMRICENHQNGKDTHVRGFQVFAKDESDPTELRRRVRRPKNHKDRAQNRELVGNGRIYGLRAPEWIGEMDIR